jgi:hypothetical protein
MTDRVRIIKHEAVPQCGSFEVRYPDDRPNVYLPSRRLNPQTLDRDRAEQARAVSER